MGLITCGTNIFSKFSLKDANKSTNRTSKIIKASPVVIAQHVYQDILLIKNEIKKYNEVTGLLASNGFYYKLYKLIETDHNQELNSLKKKHEYDTSPKNMNYHRELVSLYKKFLQEYEHLLDIFENNYNHGIYESNIIKYRNRNNKNSSNHSKVSGSSSRSYSNLDSMCLSIDSANLDKITAEAPDNLVDPISFNLFNDPVITPSGITYEKCHLIHHLIKKGKFDPLTRTPLNENQLYPNLVIKDAVVEYFKSKEADIPSV